MGGIYNSVRIVPKKVQVQKAINSGVVTPRSFDGTYALRDTQTTTSYRSSGRQGDQEVLPASTGEFLTYLREAGATSDPPTYDIGHEFSTTKITRDGGLTGKSPVNIWKSSSSSTRHSHFFTNNRYLHNGVWRDCEGDPDPSWFITTNDIASGNQAISLASPTRPVANLSTMVGELISSPFISLPGARLLQTRAKDALELAPRISRNLGSEYLNVMFGWVPLISDINKIISACLNANKIISDYSRGSGQMTRRHYKLPDLQMSYLYKDGNVWRGNANYGMGYNPDGSLIASSGGGFSASVNAAGMVVSVSAKQSRWFTGGYTYLVPGEGAGLISDLSRFEALANKLLGTRLTPEVLWELAPWSWLVDWIYGIQANLAVISQFQHDDLVLRYGYLTVRDEVEVSTLFDIRAWFDAPVSSNRSAFTRITYDRKRRIKSTPFGFGLQPASDFSARQWSILAALGMTRGPRTLR